MKTKELLIAFVLGLVVGAVAMFVSYSPRFRVLRLNEATAMRFNPSTGESWLFRMASPRWEKVPEGPPKVDFQPDKAQQ